MIKERHEEKVFLYCLLISTFLIALFRVIDTDVWTHLSLGRIFFKAGGLISEEVLNYTVSGQPSRNEEWLFQVIFYGIYFMAGVKGMIIFKSLIVTGIFYFLYKDARARGSNVHITIAGLFFAALLSQHRFFERPEIFVYLFISIFMFILNLYRFKGKNRLYLLLPLQILWINMHPSAIIGIFILILITAGYGIKQAFTTLHRMAPELKSSIRNMLILVLGLAAASMVNPYLYAPLITPFGFAVEPTLRGIAEMMSIRYTPIFPYYMIFIGVGVLSFILTLKRLDITDLLLFSFFAFLPFGGVRFIALAVIIAAPIIIRNLTVLLESLELRTKLKWVFSSVIIAIIATLLYMNVNSKEGARFGLGVEEEFFPVKAVDFIKKERIPGKMFNSFDWGGYLAFKLFPEYQTFIDGRISSKKVFFDHDKVDTGDPSWIDILDKYGVNFILTNSTYFDSGELFPLIEKLYSTDHFKLIYCDDNSLIFIRNILYNESLIKMFDLPKERIFDEIISECEYLIRESPKRNMVYKTLGYAYIMKQRYKEAKEAYSSYIKKNPGDKGVTETLRILADMGY